MTTASPGTPRSSLLLPAAAAVAALVSTVPTHAASTVEDIQKAIDKGCLWLSQHQNPETVDPILAKDGIGTTQDGGFRYAPDDTRGPIETLDDGTKLFSSYGSMTYAGLKSLLHARVAKDDPRVKQAFAWISKNFTVKENPGMATTANPKAGQQGLFYYYHTMSKALSVYGEPTIRDAKGVDHSWAQELADHLLAIQKADGSWRGESDRWWEDIPALDTAYAVIALSECEAALRKGREATGAK